MRTAAETATVLSSRKPPTTHNITIMGLSVAVALVIATIELGALVPSELDLSGSLWKSFQHIDTSFLGLAIVGLFLGTGAIALSVWRLAHVEPWSAKWETPGEPAR